MIDYDGDTPIVLLSSVGRKARKRHKCMECYRVINVGEQYLVEGYISDGEKFTHKTCGNCVVARNYLADNCGGFVYGLVQEDIKNHVFEVN
jgi:hypothetical protein